MKNPKILNNVKLIEKCILLSSDGKLLALKRTKDDKSRPSCWDLPGGGYEQGEDTDEAIKREVFEECGLKLHSSATIYFTSRIGEKVGFFLGDTVFAVCRISSDWSGEVVLSSEHVEFRWVTPDEFLNLNFGDDSGFFRESILAYKAFPHSY